MSSCRICARCGALDVYSLGAGPKVIRARCKSCEKVARLRPIADDWDGSWDLDGEDDADEPADETSDDPRSSVSKTQTVDRDEVRPVVAGSYSPAEDEDSGPWCPKCEGDVEDDEVGGEAAYWCPTCKSLYPSDEVLTPGDEPAATNHGGDSVAADGGPKESEDVDVVDPTEEDPEGGLWRWSE